VRRGQLRLIAITAGAQTSAGVCRGGKAPRGLVAGRLLDGVNKEKASSAPPGRTFTQRAQNPGPPLDNP
jgi:hypothetical protein